MFRAVFILLTVLDTILCPFLCAGYLNGPDADRVARTERRSSCPCCRHDAGATEEQPCPAGQGDRGTDPDCGLACLCKGAVPVDQPVRFSSSTDARWVSPAPLIGFSGTSSVAGSATWLSGGPPAGYPVGRAARLVYMSLLC